MEILLDCVPCLLEQALKGSRLATNDKKIQEEIIKDAIEILGDYKSYKTSPELARAIHQSIKLKTGLSDPYVQIKEKDLEAAKSVYPMLKDFLERVDNKLYWALKIAATGNNLDAAIYGNVDINECIEKELEKKFAINDFNIFHSKLETANSILIIGDNTGETIFDKVLIENIANINVTYAVRSEPIINDATIKEAVSSELHHVAEVISSGCNAPGLILDECSDEFLKAYRNADIIISKGQGNYEALSEVKNIFFLLKAKCSMIAGRLNVELNDYILKYSGKE